MRNKRNKAQGALNKRNKKQSSLNKRFRNGVVPAEVQLLWREIDTPWRELGLLHQLRDEYEWDRLPIPDPKPLEERQTELACLHEWQKALRAPDMEWLRARIRTEAGNDLTANMQPLGGSVIDPLSETAVMFQTLIWLGGLIVQRYKARFQVPRPSEIDPTLQPFLPVPAHSSYPSGHALQSFLIAEVFSRAVPEHDGIPALYRAAWDVSVNRERAGLHLRSDTEAGRMLARLCMPVIERVMERQIRNVRTEWY